MNVKEIQKIITEKIYGVWEPNHDSSGHRYFNTKTQQNKKSVTTKLGILSKPHLAKWQIRMAIEWLCVEDRWQRLQVEHWKDEVMTGAMMAPFDVRDDAGSVGTAAHNSAERFLNDWIASGVMPEDITKFAPENCDPRSIAAMRAMEAWFKKEKITPIASELLVGNKYSAGTLDLLYLDKQGNLCIGDFKTSNGVDQIGYSAQVAAYRAMFQEMTGLKIYQCKILLVSKDSDKFTVYKVMNLNKAYTAFKRICEVYDWIMTPGEKIEKDIKKIKI